MADKPGTPDVIDWSANHAELKWEPPASDGGAPIEGYIIEKKDKYSPLWEKAAEIVGPECKGIVRGLTEGQQYQFRVICLNVSQILSINLLGNLLRDYFYESTESWRI